MEVSLISSCIQAAAPRPDMITEMSWREWRFEALDTDCTRSVCRGYRDWFCSGGDALAVHAGECGGGLGAKVWQPCGDQKLPLEFFPAAVRGGRRDVSAQHPAGSAADCDGSAPHDRR